MVTYALKKYNGDASKVFVTGSSSGAMMTVSSPYRFLFDRSPLGDMSISDFPRH